MDRAEAALAAMRAWPDSFALRRAVLRASWRLADRRPRRQPDQVVAEFLGGGSHRATTSGPAELLTPLARQKTAEMEMVVAPPGSDTASFKIVATCELVGEQAARDHRLDRSRRDGRPHTDRIVWILRKRTGGWRISGMATKVFADRAADRA